MKESNEHILIGADLVPYLQSAVAFKEGKMDALFTPELFNKLQSAAVRVFNLETPITSCGRKIQKSGPHLCASPETMT